jgi:hypothetical protein
VENTITRRPVKALMEINYCTYENIRKSINIFCGQNLRIFTFETCEQNSNDMTWDALFWLRI